MLLFLGDLSLVVRWSGLWSLEEKPGFWRSFLIQEATPSFQKPGFRRTKDKCKVLYQILDILRESGKVEIEAIQLPWQISQCDMSR